MSVQPMGDILSEVEREEACEFGAEYGCCDAPAEWMARQSHCLHPDGTHGPNYGYLCEDHRKAVADHTAAWLRGSSVCSCGYSKAGQLSDHFRAIRL